MQPILKGSFVLAALVGIFSLIFYMAGLHENFVLGQALFVGGAIAINVGVVVWLLGQTARDNTYGQQVATATGVGLLGGALVVGVSWLLLALVFPNALDELRAGAMAYMETADMTAEEVAAQTEMLATATPVSQSLPGGIGTFFTSLATGLVYGFFARRR